MSTSAFSLAEWPAVGEGGVTALRRETKYALPRSDAGKVRAILEANCRAVAYAGPVSCVNSIYFDDVRLSGCDENIEGVGRRTKVRLRWYDSPYPNGGLFFEVKRRRGVLTSKERYLLRNDVPLGVLSYRQIVRDLGHVLPDGARELLRARPCPVVLIEYQRRHYASPDGAARLTLDQAVRFHDQCGRVQPSRAFGRALDDLVILEVKTPPGAEEAIARLLHPLRLRVTKSSKYVQCCQGLAASTGAQTACLR